MKYGTTAIVVSKQSQLNRIEAAVLQDIRNEHPILGRVPRIRVSYFGGEALYTDLELPHCAFDGHIRAGTIGGQPITADPVYRSGLGVLAEECEAMAR